MLARTLVTAASAIILALGVIHLIYTFRGTKLTPSSQHVALIH